MHQMCWNIQLQYLTESDLERSVKSGEKLSRHFSLYVDESGHHLTTGFNQSSLNLIFWYIFLHFLCVKTLQFLTYFISAWFHMARSHDGQVVVCNHSLLGWKLTENVFIWVNLISNLKKKSTAPSIGILLCESRRRLEVCKKVFCWLANRSGFWEPW